MKKSKSIVIYPGTFDPITKGHQDLIVRALDLFDEVIVAIAVSSSKNSSFSVLQRIEMATKALAEYSKVSVVAFQGLLIDFVHESQSNIILRGLRAISDFEYEFQLAGMNRKLAEDIETVFMTPSEKFTYISSSLVKEVARLGGDVEAFVASHVAKELQVLYSS